MTVASCTTERSTASSSRFQSVRALTSRTASPFRSSSHERQSETGFGTFYDVAPDGRFLINILVERTSPPVAVVLNWRADDQSPPR